MIIRKFLGMVLIVSVFTLVVYLITYDDIATMLFFIGAISFGGYGFLSWMEKYHGINF